MVKPAMRLIAIVRLFFTRINSSGIVKHSSAHSSKSGKYEKQRRICISPRVSIQECLCASGESVTIHSPNCCFNLVPASCKICAAPDQDYEPSVAKRE